MPFPRVAGQRGRSLECRHPSNDAMTGSGTRRSTSRVQAEWRKSWNRHFPSAVIFADPHASFRLPSGLSMARLCESPPGVGGYSAAPPPAVICTC